MLLYVMFEIKPVVLKFDFMRAPFWELRMELFWNYARLVHLYEIVFRDKIEKIEKVSGGIGDVRGY